MKNTNDLQEPNSDNGEKWKLGDELNRANFEELVRNQFDLEDIAKYFLITDNELSRFVKKEYGADYEFIEKKILIRERYRLRKEAYKQAKKNPVLMIFLLKNICGMKDFEKERFLTDEEKKAEKIFSKF